MVVFEIFINRVMHRKMGPPGEGICGQCIGVDFIQVTSYVHENANE